MGYQDPINLFPSLLRTPSFTSWVDPPVYGLVGRDIDFTSFRTPQFMVMWGTEECPDRTRAPGVETPDIWRVSHYSIQNAAYWYIQFTDDYPANYHIW